MYYLRDYNRNSSPEILIVNIDGLSNEIHQLEYETGLYIDSDSTLNAITDCIKCEQSAKTELEYYCLNLAAEQCNGEIYAELNSILHFLIDFGSVLFRDLRNLGMYQNGILPYAYRNRRNDAVRFMRRDALMKQIKKELSSDGLYPTTSTYSTEYKRTIPRDLF